MSQFGVIVQPTICSYCSETFNNSIRTQRFLKCGCVVCAPCSISKKLRTMITCPTCSYQYNLQQGDLASYYHEELNADDIESQKRRCHYYRDQIRELENKGLQVSESEPLSSDLLYPPHLSKPVILSDDSLEITSSASDVADEYRNTEYCIIANRLAMLIKRRQQLISRVGSKIQQQKERQRKPAIEEKNEERRLTIQTEKARRQRDRRTLITNRRLRMLVQHGAQLDEVKVVKKVKKKTDEDEEQEEELEEDEGKTPVDPASIEAVLELLQGEQGHFVRLNYNQRWKLKTNGWKQWKLLLEERTALLEQRMAEEENSAKSKRTLDVLRQRAAEVKKLDTKITAKIDARLEKLEKRAKHVPGRTVLTKKLAQTNAERIYILTLFYPERLPKEPEKKKDEDDDDY